MELSSPGRDTLTSTLRQKSGSLILATRYRSSLFASRQADPCSLLLLRLLCHSRHLQPLSHNQEISLSPFIRPLPSVLELAYRSLGSVGIETARPARIELALSLVTRGAG